MEINQAWIIIAITWLAVISPGADFAIVSRNSSVHDRYAGLASSIGIAFGCFIHVGYAIVGIGFISDLFPNFFQYLQIIGGIYLAYLGLSLILSKNTTQSEIGETINLPSNKIYFFGMGFLTNILNPKTSLFIISLYSQAIGAETVMMEKLFWGAFIAISHFIWFGGVALFMSTPLVRTKILSHQKIFNSTIGLILVVFSLLLLLNNNI